jgi:hypothetical protein
MMSLLFIGMKVAKMVETEQKNSIAAKSLRPYGFIFCSLSFAHEVKSQRFEGENKKYICPSQELKLLFQHNIIYFFLALFFILFQVPDLLFTSEGKSVFYLENVEIKKKT